MSRTVQQIIFPAREQAELSKTRPARTVGPSEVAGRTLTSVLSTGTELGMQYCAEDGFPHEPGYGAVLEIEEVGTEVKDITPGDHVFCIGKHASRQCFPREKVIPVPHGLAPEIAVLARMAAISWSCLSRAKAQPPAKVLVTGLGAVGHFAVRIFADAAYTVAAVDPDPDRRALLTRFAPIRTFQSPDGCGPEWQDQVELALECSGNEQAVQDACCTMAKHGEVMIVGVPWTNTGVSAKTILFKVFWRYLTLRSGWEWELPWEDYRDNCVAILDRLADGRLGADGLYRTVSPADCQQVYQDLLHKRVDTLCTVFDWDLI